MAKTALFEIESYLEAAERDPSVYEEKNFARRIEVIDFIEPEALDLIEQCLQLSDHPNKLDLLKHRTENVLSELERINTILFRKLQASIRTGEFTGEEFRKLIAAYVGRDPEFAGYKEETGYDNLDVFVNGLFSFQDMPMQTRDLEPEMLYYQKTPARIVFELVEKARFTKEDIFFDLGSGLGQAAILVSLLAGIKATGIEFEPAFCDYARVCAAGLNATGTTFIHADARKADYSKGTAFFMFTPFRGKILEEVLAVLREQSLHRKIKIFTYGPCTDQVAAQSWLDVADPGDINIYKLAIFSSF